MKKLSLLLAATFVFSMSAFAVTKPVAPDAAQVGASDPNVSGVEQEQTETQSRKVKHEHGVEEHATKKHKKESEEKVKNADGTVTEKKHRVKHEVKHDEEEEAKKDE